MSAGSKATQAIQQRMELPIRSAKWIGITSIQMTAIIVLMVSTDLMEAFNRNVIFLPKCRALKNAWSRSGKAIEGIASKIGDWILEHTKDARPRRHQGSTRAWGQRGTVLAMSVLAMQAHATVATERHTTFDTDSETVGIDNRCSGCISHVRGDFIGDLRPSNRVVKGFAGSRTTNVQVGTLRWSWEDDLGSRHTFTIPNSYYVPDGQVRLLSPQHWSQTQTKHSQRERCGEYTNGRECVLYWKGGEHKLRIPLGKRDNVATFYLASGFEKFRAFCCEAALDVTDKDVIAMPSGLVSDDDEEPEEQEAPSTIAWKRNSPATHTQEPTIDLNGPSNTPSTGEMETTKAPTSEPKTTEMGLEKTTNVNVIIDEEDRQPANDLAQLLKIHHQFGHISMRKIQEMARQGIVPRRLAKCRIPTCSA